MPVPLPAFSSPVSPVSRRPVLTEDFISVPQPHRDCTSPPPACFAGVGVPLEIPVPKHVRLCLGLRVPGCPAPLPPVRPPCVVRVCRERTWTRRPGPPGRTRGVSQGAVDDDETRPLVPPGPGGGRPWPSATDALFFRMTGDPPNPAPPRPKKPPSRPHRTNENFPSRLLGRGGFLLHFPGLPPPTFSPVLSLRFYQQFCFHCLQVTCLRVRGSRDRSGGWET